MIKNTLTFAAVMALTTSLIAGGDDRDLGPVESLDSMQPIVGKTVIMNNAPDTMTLTTLSNESKVIGSTPTGIPVTQAAHIACEDKLELSASNIAKFKEALAGGFLYNVGPINENGTLFSPERWADYFDCVEKQ